MSVEYKVALRSHDTGGVLFINTFAVKSDPVGPDLEEPSHQAVADAIKSWLQLYYQGILAPRYTWDDVLIRQIHGTAEALSPVGVLGTLTVGAALLPKECSVILSKKTAVATRSGRGYM